MGQTLAVPWLRVWKGGGGMRVDGLYDDAGAYSPARAGGQRLKGFAWADDGNTMYSGEFIHTSRSPMGGSTAVVHDVGLGLLHLQFVHWHDFVVKQAWYKMIEAQRGAMPVAGIALKYRFSLDSTHERVLPLHPAMSSACPSCWLQLLANHRAAASCPSAPSQLSNWRESSLVQWFAHAAGQEHVGGWAPAVTGALDDVLRNQVPLGRCQQHENVQGQPQQQQQQQRELLVIFLAPTSGDAISPLHAAAGGGGGATDDGGSDGEESACSDWDFRPLLQNMAQVSGLSRDTMDGVSLHVVTTAPGAGSVCPAFAAWTAELQLLQQNRRRLHPQLHINTCSCTSLCSIPAQLSCARGFIAKNGSGIGTAVALLPFGFYRCVVW